MTPDQLATLHAVAFTGQRPWSAREFADLLAAPSVFLSHRPHGFALGRVAADEAELLTLAVAPAARRQGIGRQLLAAFEAAAQRRGATIAFLDVADDNCPAIALYRSAGYAETGRRVAYYQRPDAPAAAALMMTKALTLR